MDLINDVIYPVIDEIADSLEEPSQIEKSPDTVLFGQNGVLTSLALVSLIVALEERIEDETGCVITIANEKAMSRENSPFHTVAALAAYIEELLEEAPNE